MKTWLRNIGLSSSLLLVGCFGHSSKIPSPFYAQINSDIVTKEVFQEMQKRDVFSQYSQFNVENNSFIYRYSFDSKDIAEDGVSFSLSIELMLYSESNSFYTSFKEPHGYISGHYNDYEFEKEITIDYSMWYYEDKPNELDHKLELKLFVPKDDNDNEKPKVKFYVKHLLNESCFYIISLLYHEYFNCDVYWIDDFDSTIHYINGEKIERSN